MTANYNFQVRCNSCGKANARARVSEVRTRTHIIKEAKYVCPLCNAYVKRDEISRTPIKTD